MTDDPTPAPRCALTHRKQRPPATRGRLCAACATRLHATLIDIANQIPMLALLTLPGTTDWAGIATHRADPPAPCRLDILAITDPRTGIPTDGDVVGVLGVLNAWATIVREERALTHPTARPTMTSELRTLLTHHHWTIAQPWVDDYAAELRACHRQLNTALGITGPTCVGHCPVELDTGPCLGRLEQDRWGGMGVRCTRCGARWDDTDLRRLGAMLAT